MAKIYYILLFLLLTCGVVYSEQSNVKIVLENGYYYTQLENGEKYQIVKHQEPWAINNIVISPDQEFVAYTTANGLGFESEGRDVYYCKVDGSDKTFLHRFQNCIDSLLWQSVEGKNFMFVIPKNCQTDPEEIQIVDLQSKQVILAFVGDSLVEVPGTDCYKVYYRHEPPPTGRQKVCLQDLLSVRGPDSVNVGFFTSWDSGDIYSSTQSEPVLKLSDLPELSKSLGKDFGRFLEGRYFYITYIFPTSQNNRIVFIGEASTLGLFGIFDLNEKKLLSLDYSNDQRFLNASWSPDGIRFAVIRMSNWQKYIDFYEVDEEGKVDLIKTYRVPTNQSLSDLKWSDDSKKFYYSYLFSNYQKVQVEVDLEDE